MKLYIKQQIFTWGDKFHIYDEYENEKYYVEGEVFSFEKKLHLYNNNEYELAFIHQQLFSFLPKYFISIDGIDVAQVVKEFTFLWQKYKVEDLGWTVSGDFTGHEYSIDNGDMPIASVSKRWFSWGDTYEIDIYDDNDEIMALCVVLIIDAVIAQSEVASASANN